MIGVITAAKQSGCILGYDLGDKKSKDQRIKILDYEGVFMDPLEICRLNENWTDTASKKEFKKLSRKVANDLAKQFTAQSKRNDNVDIITGHIALSFSPADREKLTDSLKIEIAREYMERMGITDTQWVLTEHFDTNAPHVHIAYNRVRFDRTSIDRSFERIRSMKISHELSEKYGLTPAGETERKRSSLHPDQQVYNQIREHALEVLEYCLSLSEFEADLADRGIFLQKSRHSDGKLYGFSYSVFDGGFAAKGSKLDRQRLSFKGVMTAIQNNINRFNKAYSSLPSEDILVKEYQEKGVPTPQPVHHVKSVQKLAKLKNVPSADKQSTKEAINKAELVETDENKKPGIKI